LWIGLVFIYPIEPDTLKTDTLKLKKFNIYQVELNYKMDSLILKLDTLKTK